MTPISKPADAHGELSAEQRACLPDTAYALRSYVDRHPRALERFRPILDETLGAPIDLEGTIPLVALQLTSTAKQW